MIQHFRWRKGLLLLTGWISHIFAIYLINLRSTAVIQSLDDWLTGKRFDLSILHHLRQ